MESGCENKGEIVLMYSPGQLFVRFLIEQGALIRPDKPLRSGRKSPYMLNFGVCSTGPALESLGTAYAVKSIELGGVHAYFGPAYKGIFIAGATAGYMWTRYKRDVGVAAARKEIKDHGEGGLLLGAPIKGRTICIVDDVLTEGDSLRTAARLVASEGGVLAGCVVGFDRQERVCGSQSSVRADLCVELGVPILAIASLNDLEVVLSTPGDTVTVRCRSMLSQIRDYKRQYCVS